MHFSAASGIGLLKGTECAAAFVHGGRIFRGFAYGNFPAEGV